MEKSHIPNHFSAKFKTKKPIFFLKPRVRKGLEHEIQK